MDGVFVSSLSFPAERLNDIETSLPFEVHLMVKHPFTYMSRIFNPLLKRVIFHFESDVNHIEFIDQMRKRGLEVGMAIKPETELEEFSKISEEVDSLLFLTVDPGSYGSPLRPEVLNRIRGARQLFKNKILAADGAVSLDNLKLFFETGLDYVCVGSRIFLTEDPKHNYEMFVRKLMELEVYK
jgi:ribulose-phosphate 3-epimerase